MIINYTDADGRIIELEVTDEVGSFYLTSIEEEKRNERRETRRHTPLSQFQYEDKDYFDSGIDLLKNIIESDTFTQMFAALSERQRYLINKVVIEGWSYTELAAREGKHESTIRKATEKAKNKLMKNLQIDYPI